MSRLLQSMSRVRGNLRLGARRTVIGLIALAVIVLLSGCATLLDAAVGIGTTVVGIETEDTRWALALQGIETLGDVVDAANSPFTPEQEYFVGRSVAATIMDQYPPFVTSNPNLYVNRLGQSLALASDRPEIYNGYVFQILETDEINAFATPGGHIFISRGMIRLTESEAELAAVLAHEIAHVVERHGLGSIRSSRVIGALQDGALSAIDTVTGDQLEELTAVFSDATGEVIEALISTGYSTSTELEADGDATVILRRLGYDPHALIRLLARMEVVQRAQYDGNAEPVGFARTHPRPQVRIDDLLANELSGIEPGGRVDEAAADARYRQALGGI